MQRGPEWRFSAPPTACRALILVLFSYSCADVLLQALELDDSGISLKVSLANIAAADDERDKVLKRFFWLRHTKQKKKVPRGNGDLQRIT